MRPIANHHIIRLTHRRYATIDDERTQNTVALEVRRPITAKDRAFLIAEGMEQMRGLDVMLLHMGEVLPITEYFIICHGRSQTHVDAIADGLQEYLDERDLHADHREGDRGAQWVVIDYGVAVAHVFTSDARDFYDLERLWEDAAVVDHLTETGQSADTLS